MKKITITKDTFIEGRPAFVCGETVEVDEVTASELVERGQAVPFIDTPKKKANQSENN